MDQPLGTGCRRWGPPVPLSLKVLVSSGTTWAQNPMGALNLGAGRSCPATPAPATELQGPARKIPQLHPGKSGGEAAKEKRGQEKSRCSPALPGLAEASPGSPAWPAPGPLRVPGETSADLRFSGPALSVPGSLRSHRLRGRVLVCWDIAAAPRPGSEGGSEMLGLGAASPITTADVAPGGREGPRAGCGVLECSGDPEPPPTPLLQGDGTKSKSAGCPPAAEGPGARAGCWWKDSAPVLGQYLSSGRRKRTLKGQIPSWGTVSQLVHW